jgi:hypothetical protein
MSTGPFSIAMLVYQRVYVWYMVSLEPWLGEIPDQQGAGMGRNWDLPESDMGIDI